ncbi:MAG: glycosyltransferase family 9 protein [Kiritimatiellia bacterium]
MTRGTPLRYLLLDGIARRLPATPPRPRAAALAVYSPGHLGDLLHAVPMLKALRQGQPEAKVIWLVGPWSESLARRYAPCVDDVRTWGPNLPQYARGKREWRQSARHQWRMAMDLRKEGVDVFIGPMDGVGRFLANAIVPRLWVGIGDRRPPRVREEIETIVQPYEKDRYEADALCGLLKSLGIEAKADRLEYEVNPEERKAADGFLQSERVDLTRPLALIAPGSGWTGKNWLPERFGETAQWLATDNGCQVAWVGGPGEESLVPAFRANDFNWIGKTPLPLLAAVMERARLFIGNDGGLLHLAAALNVPTVSVWGPTSPGKWAPKGALHRHIRKAERCEGCIYWDYREICRHDRACMKAVATAEVLAAIRDVWKPR